MNQTIAYYNNNSQSLCSKYESIDLSSLQNDLLLFFKDCKSLLEVGSGSGRDMNFMMNNGFKVSGIDGSEKMIKEAVSKYPYLSSDIYLAELPTEFPFFNHKFDGLYSIATFMHFNIDELDLFLKKLLNHLKPDALVFISVSGLRSDKNEDRFFLELSCLEWINLFEKNNFKVINVKKDKDFLRRKINWYSFFLKAVF